MPEQPTLKIMPYQRSIFTGEDAVPSQRKFEPVDPATGDLAYQDLANSSKAARAAQFLIAQRIAQAKPKQEATGEDATRNAAEGTSPPE